MALIDRKTADGLLASVNPIKKDAGGAAANSVANISLLGGKGAFIGITSKDKLGYAFNDSLRNVGVLPVNAPSDNQDGTGRSFVFITPGGQRTMFTYLGSSDKITHRSMNYSMLSDYKVFFTEAFLWDKGPMTEVTLKAFDEVHKAGGMTAYTLSAAFVVKNNREDFIKLMPQVDIVFGNEDEVRALFDTDDTDYALAELRKISNIAVITLGKKGAVIMSKDIYTQFAAPPAPNKVDTTGAGDGFAAGFLYAFTQGYDLQACAELGSRVAGEIIQQYGARSEKSLKHLL